MSYENRKANAFYDDMVRRRERIRERVDSANSLQNEINLRARKRVHAYLVAQNNLLRRRNDANETQINALVGSFQTAVEVLVDVIDAAEQNIVDNKKFLRNDNPSPEYEQHVNIELNAQVIGSPPASSIPDYYDDIDARCENLINRLENADNA